jgi:hypothetical protein
MVKLTSQQIGRCGELLVQYMLLKHGVESAPLTTDPGIDLVAFPNVSAFPDKRGKPVTIQVKTSTHHSEASDPMCKWLLWEIPNNCPADYIAALDFECQKSWLIPTKEFIQKATHPTKELSRLWWYIPGCEPAGATKREGKFKEYEMDTAIPKVFGLE